MSAAPWLATLLILGTGCRAATPCRGARFDADAPDPQCLVRHEVHAPVAIEAIAVRLEGPPLAVASGAAVSFVLALENISEAPLDVPVPGGCTSWMIVASNPETSSFETECGGLCGSGPTMPKVTLEPGGVLTKKLSFEAIRTRIAGENCEEKKDPLPPGDYTLEISLPWTHPAPIPGNDQARDHHRWSTPLKVLPASTGAGG